MVLLVTMFQQLYSTADKASLFMISKAVRDCEMEHLVPGSKPQKAEKAALATSLVGHRMSKEELKQALAKGNKWTAPQQQQQQQQQHPNPPKASNAPFPAKGHKAGKNTQAQQTERSAH